MSFIVCLRSIISDFFRFVNNLVTKRVFNGDNKCL